MWKMNFTYMFFVCLILINLHQPQLLFIFLLSFDINVHACDISLSLFQMFTFNIRELKFCTEKVITMFNLI